MPPTASSIISDALSSLSKAANLALATVEDQARLDVGRANAEIEEKEWERREDAWKAAVDKAELTIKHQGETIANLRTEALQWKTQLLRLEESSRQEIADWKEQYLRAEQDRCRLSSRIDELVAEQLALHTQANAGATPAAQRTIYPDFYESSASSTATKRASTSSMIPSLPKHPTPSTQVPPSGNVLQPAHKSRPAQTPSKQRAQQDHAADATPSRAPKSKSNPDSFSSTNKTPRTTHASRPLSTKRTASISQPHIQQQSAPQQRVVRRVHAVISVPVKEEDESDAEGLQSDASGSMYEPEEQPVNRRKSGRISTSARERQAQIWRDEDSEPDGVETQVIPRRTRYVQEDDSDVDELAMDAEDGDGYVAQNAEATSPQKTSRKANTARPSSAGSGKKRKLDGDSAIPGGGRGSTAKVARKR